MDPDHGSELVENIGPAEVEFRRHSGKLAQVLPVLGDVLLPAAEDAGHVMVVVDATGVVLWRDGPKKIQQHAARLGFEVGANWSERNVGTNAIGTALVVSRPVQIYSAEHFVKAHHAWTCAAAPILDPANGDLLGVVDVSGAAATVHPSTLALVDAAARMAESFLREEHHAAMNSLRALAGPLLAGSHQPTMVTDRRRLGGRRQHGSADISDRPARASGLGVGLVAGFRLVPVGAGAGRMAGPGPD